MYYEILFLVITALFKSNIEPTIRLMSYDKTNKDDDWSAVPSTSGDRLSIKAIHRGSSRYNEDERFSATV
jgi:hypothetical protein